MVLIFEEYRWDAVVGPPTTFEDVRDRYRMEWLRGFQLPDGRVVGPAQFARPLAQYRPSRGPLILRCLLLGPLFPRRPTRLYFEADGAHGALPLVLGATTTPSQLSAICWSIAGSCHPCDFWHCAVGTDGRCWSTRLQPETPILLQVREPINGDPPGVLVWEYSCKRETVRMLRPWLRRWRPQVVYQCLAALRLGCLRELVAPDAVWDIQRDWE